MTGKSHMTHVQVRLFFEYNSLMDEYNSSLLDDSSVEEIKKSSIKSVLLTYRTNKQKTF